MSQITPQDVTIVTNDDDDDIESELLCSDREAMVGLMSAYEDRPMVAFAGSVLSHPWERTESRGASVNSGS